MIRVRKSHFFAFYTNYSVYNTSEASIVIENNECKCKKVLSHEYHTILFVTGNEQVRKSYLIHENRERAKSALFRTETRFSVVRNTRTPIFHTSARFRDENILTARRAEKLIFQTWTNTERP